MKLLLFFAFVLFVSPLFAQEPDEIKTPQWMGPWNSHEFAPDATPFEKIELPPAAVTAFQNIQVTKSIYYQTETAVAVNPLDPSNIIISEIDGDRAESNGIYTSTDGGNTWVEASIKNNSGPSYGDPWLTFDGNGTAYVCGLFYSSSLELQIHKSTDKGLHWVPDTIIFGADPSNPDEPVLSSDLVAGSPYYNTIYAAAVGSQSTSIFPTGIKLHYRRGGATTFSAEKNVSTFQITQIPHIAIGLNGKVYVSYLGIDDIVNIKGGLYFNRSTDGGDTWSADKLISAATYTDTVNGFPKTGSPFPASRIGPTPRIVIDTSNGPRRGWLYVTYAKPTSPDGKSDLDIFLQHSSDDGETWSAPIRVNDDPIGNGKDQLTPALAINPDGLLAIVYYDRRDDPNNFLVNTYCAFSNDGGATFQNLRISDQATNPLIGRQQISLSIADYISITATKDAVYPVWTDGRKNNGDLDTYTAIIPVKTFPVNGVSPDRQTSASLDISPNPVHDRSTITFNGAVGSDVDLSLFDGLGRKVRTLHHGRSDAQNNYLTFAPETLASGMYYVTLSSGSFVMTKALSYIK
jgi:hypothetical protein